MRLIRACLFTAVWLIGTSCNRPAPGEPVHPETVTPTDAPALAYVERITGGAASDTRLPMVVAVHGLGDRPEHFESLFDGLRQPLRIVLPRAPKPYFRGYSWFDIQLPFRDAAESAAPGIAAAADRVATLTQQLSRTRPTDGKPIICGFSQGGAISFAAAARRPDLFAAAVPLSGAVPASLYPKSGRVLPKVRAAHGMVDDLIPIEGARRTVAAFRRANGDATLTEFEGLGHTLNGQMREFLFSQLRTLTR